VATPTTQPESRQPVVLGTPTVIIDSSALTLRAMMATYQQSLSLMARSQ
jgi:hypothetical protein